MLHIHKTQTQNIHHTGKHKPHTHPHTHIPASRLSGEVSNCNLLGEVDRPEQVIRAAAMPCLASATHPVPPPGKGLVEGKGAA